MQLADGSYQVDQCRAWVSGNEGEGFGYQVRSGELASGPAVAAGAICLLTPAPCNTGIRLLRAEDRGLLALASHTWLREYGGDGYLGIGFDFVGAVGPSEEPLVADNDHHGLVALREPSMWPDVITADHADLLFPIESSVAYTEHCGDVTGNGHADLCHRSGYTRVFEGPVTPQSQPWMTLLQLVAPGSPGAVGTFGADGPAMITGIHTYDQSRGGVAYHPLLPGDHTVEASDVRFAGTDGQRVGDGIGAGDLDVDGDLELVLGETYDDERTGKVRVYDDTPEDPFGELLLELFGQRRHARFGMASLVADLDGDGHPDLVVAAPGGSFGDVPGSVHIFPGPVDHISWDTAVTWSSGAVGFDHFGYSLEAFDEDGDGDLELFVGAPRFSEVEVWAGAVFSIDDPLRTGNAQ